MVLQFKEKHFHINTPYFGAWSKYGWGKSDWGFGLKKERVDKLAECDTTLYISYLRKPQLYTIKAKKVQQYPIEEIEWSKVKVYIVPRSSLNYCERTQEEIEIKEMCEDGVFG